MSCQESFFLDTMELKAIDPVVVQNMAIWMLWGFDEIPGLPFAGPGNEHSGEFYGAPGQVRVFMIKFGPDAEPEVAAGEDQLSQIISDDGNHATDTIDVLFSGCDHDRGRPSRWILTVRPRPSQGPRMDS